MCKLYTFIGGPADGLKFDSLTCKKEIYYYNTKTGNYDSALYFKESICHEVNKNALEQEYKYYEYFRYSGCTVDYCLQKLIDNYRGNNESS